MKNNIVYIKREQKRIAGIVTTKFKNYYLTGGTALNLYFNHRFSEDLDFFTQRYNRKVPDQIVKYISLNTGYSFELEAEQDDLRLVPMKVYFIKLKKGNVLKIDFVKDFMKNIERIKNGLHSINDIYIRKIIAAIGTEEKESVVGRVMPSGRQTVKDLYDIFYLSLNYKPLSNFFFRYFPKDKAEKLITWYRSFNRMDLKMELLDMVPGVDTAEILRYLDDEVLEKIPGKLV